ncbi:methyltransferase, FxLD system [Streptomyces sp. NPDC088766]|uniref:methyltransferase, FxLD system n=1 Tax=Streptomyces sp. NPDC088766 TaxID=3365893 RepID=UPI00380B4720
MTYTERGEWEQHYGEGKGWRRLGERERHLLAEHVPVPEGGGRALEVGCGTGELAAHLARAGYTVDAVDFADSAVARAREEHAGIESVRWLRLDIERDDPAPLHEDGYDLITMRLAYPFVRDRNRLVHELSRRLREGGALVVITPTVENTPAERCGIALDEDEITLLGAGWETAERLDADGLAFLVLRGPRPLATRAVEKRPTTGHALTGALAVVTDDAGRVLLGRSTRGMLELPGGKTTGPEGFAAAAVRELAEETGLVANLSDAHVVTMLVDDSHGIPRLTAVVRITAWTGTLTNAEADKFARWEFFDLHALARVGDVFVPAALALDSVWPGVIPDLPSVVSYPLAAERPPVPGEPEEAARLRQEMAQTVIDGGWAPSEPVRDALRTVPRHRFAPEVSLADAYDGGDRAVVTRRDETGTAISSVSAAWLQADMVESLRLTPGASVFEAGSGGYNAELIAHAAGAGGRVVSVDIDPWVVRRTRAFNAEAGSGAVSVVEGDAALGAPAHLVPRGGFDGSMITYNCWDVAPAWRAQLAEGGHLVLPLSIHGYTRAVTLQRRGDVLHARGWTVCGFVRDRGVATRPSPVLMLADGRVQVHVHDGPPPQSEGLEEALHAERHELPTGVLLPGKSPYDTLQIYATTTLPGACALTCDRATDTPLLAAGAEHLPALVAEGSLAYLTCVPRRQGATPQESRHEFVVWSHGPAGPAMAERLAQCVRDWDQHIRPTGYPPMAVHPATTPDHDLPADGVVVDKTASRLVFQWLTPPLAQQPQTAALAGGDRV